MSGKARDLLQLQLVISDELRILASEWRSAAPGTEEAAKTEHEKENPQQLKKLRDALLVVIENLKSRVDVVTKAREASEKKAEKLLMIGGVIVLSLPLILIVLSVSGITDTWMNSIFNGITVTGLLTLMYGPGREIRRAAKDRTALLSCPSDLKQGRLPGPLPPNYAASRRTSKRC